MVTKDGTWTFGPTNHPGYGNDIALNGVDLTNTAATKLEVANNGVLYQENGQGEWYAYHSGSWTPAAAPTASVSASGGGSTPAVSASGSSITVSSGGTLTSQDGVWTFGTTNHPGYGNDIVLNGAALTTTAATKLEVSDGVVYQENGKGEWYSYDAGAWVPGSAPSSGDSTGTTTSASGSTGTGTANSAGSTGTGSTGTGSTGAGSTGTGSTGAGSTGTGSTGTGSTGTGSTGTGSTGTGNTGTGSTGTGSTSPPSGPAYYVATDGNDSWAGDLAAPNAAGTDGPFATLARAQEAMENSSIKTTYVEGGTYNLKSTLELTAADNGETWQYYAPDGYNSAILNGGATSGSNGLVSVIEIDGASGITINGLQVENFADAGIAVHGGAAFENLFTNSVGTANANVIENNLIHNGYDDPAADIGAPFNSGGIVIEGQATNTKVYNNVVYDQVDNGIRVGSDDDANTPNDNISGTDIENNVVYDIGGAHNETAGIYIQDTLGKSTNMKIENNYIYDYATVAGDQGRGIYLDFGTSNTTVSGNVIGPTSFVEGGTSAIFLSSGSHDTITGNILDLGSSGQIVAVSYLQYAASLNSGATAVMADNVFEHNLIISDYTGTQSTNEFGITGQTYIQGGVGNPDAMTVEDNDYFNYAGGSVVTTGNGFSDSDPVTENPEISGAGDAIASGSPVFSGSVNFPGITGGWGPPGYTIQQNVTAPLSSA